MMEMRIDRQCWHRNKESLSARPAISPDDHLKFASVCLHEVVVYSAHVCTGGRVVDGNLAHSLAEIMSTSSIASYKRAIRRKNKALL